MHHQPRLAITTAALALSALAGSLPQPVHAQSGVNASHCLQLSRDTWNGLQFTNTCNQRVYFTYCYNGGSSSSFRCGSASGGHYGKGSDSVAPGGTQGLPDSASASGAAWLGCAASNLSLIHI